MSFSGANMAVRLAYAAISYQEFERYAYAPVTNPPGPVRFSPPGGLPWILETVRVPYDFHVYRMCGHIFYGARAVPGENWWSEIARCPQQTGRVPEMPSGMLPGSVR